jgi:hypothetical protein
MLNLFCDLDGVLVDFDKGVFETTGKYPHQFRNVGFMWNNLEKDPTFWKNLDWTNDGHDLWNFISQNKDKFHIQILTGLPEGKLKEPSDINKRIWCNNHLGVNIKVNTCTGSQKYKFCKPNDILIDDRYEYKEDWENAGGIFVHHVNTETTIMELKKILSLGEDYKILQEKENINKIANVTPICDSQKLKNTQFDIEYLGIFLTVATRKQLLRMFPPLYANKYADHITLAYRPNMKEISNFEFNKIVSFNIAGYIYDTKCQTVIIKFDDEILNTKLFHITISTTRNTPPVYSNDLIREKGLNQCQSEISNCTLTGKTGAMILVKQKQEREEEGDLFGISPEIKEMIFEFIARSTPEEKLIFPVGSLDSDKRLTIHKFAEKNNIISESIGDKNNRQLTLCKPRKGEVVEHKQEEKAIMRLLFDNIF